MKRGRANLQAVKLSNLTLVFNLINRSGSISRADIAHSTGLSPTTVSSLVDELIGLSMVIETGRGVSRGGGRRPILVEVNPSGGCVAAVELLSDGFSLAIFDLSGRECFKKKRAVSELSSIGQAIADEIISSAACHGRLLGVAVGVPGVINRDTWRVSSTVIPIDESNNFFDVLKERFSDIPIRLGNESGFSAYYERGTMKKRVHSLVYIDFNVGVGAGIILNDRIFNGAYGNAGEFGHVSVDFNGRKCKCGSYGCLETVASLQAMCSLTGLPPERLSERQDVVENAASALACGLNSVINIINPEAIVLGGDILILGEEFIETLKTKLRAIMFAENRERISLTYSRTSENRVTHGGGMYMLDTIFENGSFI